MTMLNRTIDHTCLAADATSAMIETLCQEAKAEQFASVCVRPLWVPLCLSLLGLSLLRDTPVKVATVIAFPFCPVSLEDAEQSHSLGHVPLSDCLEEIELVRLMGLSPEHGELDVVLDLKQFLADWQTGNFQASYQRLEAIMQAACGIPVKLIIETDVLPAEAIASAVSLGVQAQVAMIKTCTGMVRAGSQVSSKRVQGATPALITHIAECLQIEHAGHMGIKASGGIRTAAQAHALLQAGATRLGTSVGMTLIQ